MEVFYTITFFLFGIVFGSFYNVVGYRLPKNLSLVKPGSFCPKCKHALKWYELIPLFSFLFQGGKCTKCKTKISWFYPSIEAGTGLLFAISYLIFGFSNELIYSLIISSFLMIVIVSDLTYLVIPDEVTIVMSILLLITKVITEGFLEAGIAILTGAISFLFMYLLMLIGNKMFKKESLGGGDIKLMFFIGLLLSIEEVFVTIFLASAIALPVSLIYYMKKKKDIIPFGPFLLGAALILLWAQLDILKILGF